MVSIRQSLDDLDEAHRFRMAALDNYRLAVQCAADYAIELDDEITGPYRRRLRELTARITDCDSEAELEETRTLYREEMRGYRDRATAFLSRLKGELATQAGNLQRIFDSLATGDGDHEVRLNRTLKMLREMAAQPLARSLKDQLLDAATDLAQSLDELKQSHQLTVSQFLVEIQMLHGRIQALETAATLDDMTRLANRQDLQARITLAIEEGAPFFLLLLRLKNLASIRYQFGDIEGTLLAALAKRLRNCIKPSDIAARWTDDRFAVLMGGDKTESLATGKRLGEHVGGTYVFSHEGRLIRPAVQLNLGAVDYNPGESAEKLLARVEALFGALS
jgi:diguanylate cyclase (GGDEF)-like protein